MEYSFPHYLLAKQSVDDRALNQGVYHCMAKNLPMEPLRIIEVGAGIGTMLTRLLDWGLFNQAEYVLVDEMVENIAYARKWLPSWAQGQGMKIDIISDKQFHLFDDKRDVLVTLLQSDVFDFIRLKPQPADLLIAHAFLDLLPMPESLKSLFSVLKPAGMAWLTINFDGETTFEPAIDPKLDRMIEGLYHQTMDNRPSGGDSLAGRHLFGHLAAMKTQIMAAGSSDWVVFPMDGSYPADEAYFLNFILYFFETSLGTLPSLDSKVFSAWLAERKLQVQRAELIYIAHQIDFLVKPAVV